MKVRVVTTARALIFDAEGSLLLVKNKDGRHWYAPGGWLDGFETLEECCKREVYEELGLKVEPLELVKIGYFMQTAEENVKHRENINKIEHFFRCEVVGGSLETDSSGKILNWEDHDNALVAFAKFFTGEELATADVLPEWIKFLLT